MLAKLLAIIGLASAGLLFLMLTMTTPANAGAFGILAIFLLGYVIMTVIVTFLLYFAAGVFKRLMAELKIMPLGAALTMRRSYYYASVVALAPVIFISLQSVGGVGIYEVILVLFFVVLGCVYITKRSH